METAIDWGADMVHQAMAWVLVALGVLATATLLFLGLARSIFAESPLVYWLGVLAVLVAVWWDLIWHVRIIRSRSTSDPDRMHRVKVPRDGAG